MVRYLRQILCCVGFVVLSLAAVSLAGNSAERAVLHAVKPGETLSSIAALYGTTVENLASLNSLSNPNSIRAGDILVVALKPQTHVVQRGESLWAIAQKYGVTVDALLLFNHLPNPDYVLPGQSLIIPPAGGADALPALALQLLQRQPFHVWPVDGGGVITSLYGPRNGRMHKGLDIAAPTGTRVLAAAPGRVTYADWAGTYGMLVVIDHEDGTLTRYAHNSHIVVRPGQRVEAGQHIADVGSTGLSTGPHLHFEVEIAGETVDPLPLLPAHRGQN